MKCCVEAVLFCARQCIGLRGRAATEDLSTNGNPGNFLAALKMISQHDEKLKKHLEKPTLKNATYLSPQTQNEIIDVIGNHMIQKKIIEEIKEAKYFAIMVDEVTSHNQELMPLCIRFVDHDCQIREELLKIIALPRVTGEHIAQAFKEGVECMSRSGPHQLTWSRI